MSYAAATSASLSCNFHEGHMNESCQTCEWVVSFKYEYIYESHEWVMSWFYWFMSLKYEYTNKGHMHGSFHTCEWVVYFKYVWTYAGQKNESCHAFGWDLPLNYQYTRECHVNEPCNALSWATSFKYCVATISSLLKIIGLLCKRALYKRSCL